MRSISNYRAKNVNNLPEGVQWSSWSKKWVARVKDEEGKIISIGQHADKAVAEKIYENHIKTATT